MLDAWRNPFARLTGSSLAADEDALRDALDDAEREADELAREAEAELSMTPAERKARDAAERARWRADDLATYGAVGCPECGAEPGEFCQGRETSSHYGRAVAFVRRG